MLAPAASADSAGSAGGAGETGGGELPHRHPRDCQGQPGFRAPHVVVRSRGEQVSTLDLFGRDFVLLAGPRGAVWPDAARDAASRLRVELSAYLADDGSGDFEDAGDRFCAAYGISPEGAVLVRPDGFVAWRAADADGATVEVMASVLSRVLCRADA